VPREYREERAGDHEGTEGDLVLPGATSGRHERDAVDGGEQEPGEAARDEGGPSWPNASRALHERLAAERPSSEGEITAPTQVLGRVAPNESRLPKHPEKYQSL
jgi:hypothetical protein